MPYALTEQQKQEEIKLIQTRPWPLGCILPIKRSSKTPGNMPDSAVIFEDHMDRVYLVPLTDVLEASEEGKSVMKTLFSDGGPEYIDFGPSFFIRKDKTSIAKFLEGKPYETFESLEKIIDAGWVVD
jgi:hypothetical protein